MSISLKVVCPADGVTKVLRFSEKDSINEVCKNILSKINTQGGKDHGIFLPTAEGDKIQAAGKWLRNDKTIESYDLRNNDTIHYQKRHDVMRIRLVDNSLKTVLVDWAATINDVVDQIGKKLTIKNIEEYSLQAESSPGLWLKTTLSIPEQVLNLDQVFIFKKKFFVNDFNVDQDDPFSLHLVYCQSRDEIISGKHPVTREEAYLFAALQSQIQSGNYNPAVHLPGTLALTEVLPPQFQKKDMEKPIHQNGRNSSQCQKQTLATDMFNYVDHLKLME